MCFVTLKSQNRIPDRRHHEREENAIAAFSQGVLKLFIFSYPEIVNLVLKNMGLL